MEKVVEKVTAFILRPTPDGRMLLLLEHPFAGVQIPAGTVEPGETPEQAVVREILEETGLQITSVPVPIGHDETQLPSNQAIVVPPATVYARPDVSSFDWIQIRSAVEVQVLRQEPGFSQITYIENDCEPSPNYVSMQITGWIRREFLAQRRIRYFFYLEYDQPTAPDWQTFSDHHTFRLFWHPLDRLPSIIPPQDSWVKYLTLE
jgi:8-oxo-dGTP pyrophosphatase MutT (NUDIX family)